MKVRVKLSLTWYCFLGFDWTKKDFTTFVKACEKHGRKDYENIAKDLTKTLDEVKEYSKVFWKRLKEIQDYEKHLHIIEKGESRLKKRESTKRVLAAKCGQYNYPLTELSINYGHQKSKTYTEDEDRFLVCTLHNLGFDTDGVYDQLRQAVRNEPSFRFNWYIRSRTSTELDKRCKTLIPLIEKEIGELPPEVPEKAAKRASVLSPVKTKKKRV